MQLIITIFLFCFTALLNAQTPDTESTQSEDVVQEKSTTETETTPPQRSSRVEKLEVTGSYIRRTDIEGPSPMLVIDREQIEKTGFNTVSDVLTRSTVSPFGSGGVSEDGRASVNLKGLGSARTLVLINGQRAPGSGSSYGTGAVSPDLVPITAVERIEILRDGASATYGSDALGGVINVITRKDLDGFSVSTKYDHVNHIGGDRNVTSFAYGKTTANSSLISSVQFRIKDQVRASNINYLVDINRGQTFSTNYYDAPLGAATPRGPSPLCTEFDANGMCAESMAVRDIRKPIYNLDWVTDYSRNVGSDMTFYTTFLAGADLSGRQIPNNLSTPGQFSGMEFTTAERPAAWTSLPNYSGGDIRITHRFDDLVQDQIDRNTYAALITGLRGYFGQSDWQWDVTLNNQISHTENQNNNLASFSGARNAITSGAYDPFDLAARDTTGIGVSGLNRNQSMVHWLEAKANGNLGSLLGFDWASAAGASFASFSYFDRRMQAILDGDIMGQSGVVTDGSRQLTSVFTEFSGLYDNTLEVQFSMRGDFYSDFGNTFNPKLAFKYQATNWLSFRSSAGTGFQAPTLQNMNASLEGFLFVVDNTRCNATGQGCSNTAYSAALDTNPDLSEEKSLNLNFGTIVEPTKNFTMTLDWWFVRVTDTIGAVPQDVLFLESIDPTAPGRYGFNIQRQGNSPTGEIERITYQQINAGTEEAQGVDLELMYKLPTYFGDFRFANETTYMGKYTQEFYKEIGKDEVLGRFGNPRWRNNFTASYTKDKFTFQTIARSFADIERRQRGAGKIISPTQFDLTLLYNSGEYGQFQFGVLNLGRIQPRFDQGLQQRINADLFQGVETIFAAWRQDF